MPAQSFVDQIVDAEKEMFVITNLEAALAQIQAESVFLDWELIPEDHPFAANSPYRNGYDWLYIAERKILQASPPWIRDLRFELIGERGVLSEALSNAFCHAHDRRDNLPIHIKGHLGPGGILFSIRDQGRGFDVQDLLQKARSGKKYFQIAGNGVVRMESAQQFNIFYDMNGSRCNIYHVLKK